jgi:hypothetical protein
LRQASQEEAALIAAVQRGRVGSTGKVGERDYKELSEADRSDWMPLFLRGSAMIELIRLYHRDGFREMALRLGASLCAGQISASNINNYNPTPVRTCNPTPVRTEHEALWLIVGAPEELELLQGAKSSIDLSLIYPEDPTRLPRELEGNIWPPK